MSDQRNYSLEDLQKLPHLTAVNGKVYDLEKWAPKHPGGSDVRVFGGYDSTVHYHMLHPFHQGKPLSPAFEACCVGKFISVADDKSKTALDHSLATCRNDGFQFDSPFAVDLINTVRGYFTDRKLSPHATPQFYGRLVFYVTIWTLSVLSFARQPTLISGIIAGVFSAFIGLNVQHDANHGAMSKNPLVNTFWGCMADLIGQCRWLWIQQHVVHHHAYTNDHACDRDSTSAEPFLFFNPPAPAGLKSYGYGLGRKAIHAFQHILLFAVLPFYYFLRFDFMAVWRISKYADTVKNPWLVETHRPLTMALYITHIGCFYILPLLFHFSWSTLLLCHMRDVITSLILTMLFMLSHNAEPIKRYPTRNQCWYQMQVETSCTYGNGIAGALSGGLNYQIEHHLFPRVCSTHYPALSPLIRAVCQRHNVSYTYFPTLAENFMSTLRYMKKAGIGAMETGF